MFEEALFTDLFGEVLNYVVPQPNRNIAHLQEKQCLNKGLNELSHGLPYIIVQTQVSFKDFFAH
jgi:hypothetical protein